MNQNNWLNNMLSCYSVLTEPELTWSLAQCLRTYAWGLVFWKISSIQEQVMFQTSGLNFSPFRITRFSRQFVPDLASCSLSVGKRKWLHSCFIQTLNCVLSVSVTAHFLLLIATCSNSTIYSQLKSYIISRYGREGVGRWNMIEVEECFAFLKKRKKLMFKLPCPPQ